MAHVGVVTACVTGQELIFGSVKEAPSGWEWAGWEKDKEFLFDIIANKRNGIDLDKLVGWGVACAVLSSVTDDERRTTWLETATTW